MLELLENVSVNFDIESLESALKKAMKHQKRPVVKLNESDTDISSFVSEINDLPSLDTVLDNRRVEQNIKETVATRETIIRATICHELQACRQHLSPAACKQLHLS